MDSTSSPQVVGQKSQPKADPPRAEKIKNPFRPGDTVKVFYKVKEEDKERIQPFEGVLIAEKGAGISKTITVRKVASLGIGVERIFPLHSPNVEKIEVTKRGKVRRAKLYYLRKRK